MDAAAGPRRGRSGPPPLSGSRAALLEMLNAQPEPVPLAALVEKSRLHPNTVREHLEALVRQGLVRREKAAPTGRGRPAWLYEATGGSTASEYAGLASALASAIARTSEDPRAAATAAGEDWGRELARDRGAGTTDPATARDRAVELLDDLGFAPRAVPGHADDVRLTRCPLLAAAHRHPEVVCGVHLGIVRGALAEQGVDPDGSELFPFSEPGACRLLVPPRGSVSAGTTSTHPATAAERP